MPALRRRPRRGLWQSVRVRPPGGAGGVTVNPVTQGGLKGLRGGRQGGSGAPLPLSQQDPHADAGHESEQERGERADQEILGELAVLQGFKAGERLGSERVWTV